MSLIKKLTGVAYNGGVKIRRDKVINDGTQFLFDFANSHCSPLTGSLAIGTTIANLVDSAPVATSAGSGTATFDSKGLIFDGTSAIRLDLGTTYALATTDHDFLVILWISGPASRNTTDQGIAGFAYNTSDCEWYFRQNGANTLIAYADGHNAYWSGGSSNTSLPTSTAYGPTQYAMSWQKTTGGATITTFKDGVASSTAFYADSDLSAVVGSTNGTRAGGGASQQSGGSTAWKGTLHRLLKEDLTASGTNPATQVALDYARNSTRFV